MPSPYIIKNPIGELLLDYDGVIINKRIRKPGKPPFIDRKLLVNVLKTAYDYNINVRIITARTKFSLKTIKSDLDILLKEAGFDFEFPSEFIHCVGDRAEDSIPLRKHAQIKGICDEYKWDKDQRRTQCLFIDDSSENIEAVDLIGIQTFLAKTHMKKIGEVKFEELAKMISDEKKYLHIALQFLTATYADSNESHQFRIGMFKEAKVDQAEINLDDRPRSPNLR